MSSDQRRLEKALKEQGFDVVPTKGNHKTVYKNGRRVTTLAGTPSDHRSAKNSLADLRRAGFQWPR
ncbi:type II toxin-antitoxin system HicA family toxin [Streptomyces scabiei]|uniref:type II toxin-antitoxin system HicA family toxin n=1 Tax=Streptomyces scabiei TaxID=1930 RepID=UPI0029A89D78|nr:type II toxin-antitoxin system HicA family toxin [Streptomyces scabiei]MDX3298687.1 type II toxin-antitoxin system HicA family toxin [Streptomyces scabiei]